MIPKIKAVRRINQLLNNLHCKVERAYLDALLEEVHRDEKRLVPAARIMILCWEQIFNWRMGYEKPIKTLKHIARLISVFKSHAAA